MKTQVTKKQIMGSFKNVICVPFCGLQHTLAGYEPRFYTAGVYGWNADIYIINNDTAVVTGYRPFGNIRPDYDTFKMFETAAENNARNIHDYEAWKTAAAGLVKDFIGSLNLIDDFK